MTIQEITKTLTKEEAEKMKALGSKEEVYEFLKAKGLTDSFEEFKAFTEKVAAECAELNPDEIDAVAGGDSVAAVDAPEYHWWFYMLAG